MKRRHTKSDRTDPFERDLRAAAAKVLDQFQTLGSQIAPNDRARWRRIAKQQVNALVKKLMAEANSNPNIHGDSDRCGR